MRFKASWIVCALALAVIALAASGCGGGGTETVTVTETVSAGDTTATDTTSTEETTTDEETTTEEETTTDEEAVTTDEGTTTDETGTDTEAAGTTPDLSFLSSDKCREYVQLISSYASALSGAGGTDTERAAQALQDVADQAPDEIRDDFQTLADAYSKIADALKGVDLSSGTPDASAIAKLQKLSQEIDEQKVTQASTNISTWLTKNCTGG
jgi:hypothetical protein